eukprot:m.492197 g.492197  ORF g.492197 m.492197 type:complete len:824 (+) comp31802_c0_seq1:8-2479(+)
MAAAWWFVVVIAVLVVDVSARPAARAGPTCNLQKDVIIGEGSIAILTVSSAEECCEKCFANPLCLAFTADDHTCYIKDNADGQTPTSGRVSGVTNRPPAPWDGCLLANTTSLPFCDTKLPLKDRVNDLVARVKLDDIPLELTARESDAVSYLGIPSYYWGTNAIHGMQNTQCLKNGQCPTSFPAPCALSASWNMSLVRDMGAVIGQELRAYYNAKVHNSLDTWSPTINLNRDPRWGRNVESPGEDPHINGLFGAAYADGLQNGNDPSVKQAIVTLKHWVAYSLESFNGYTRHNYDAKVSAYDLAASYFPAFEHTVREGGALGIMCSYNEVNGKPTCGNPALTAILREDWGFQGYITSDSDAVGDIWRSHHYEPTGQLAVRDALEAGCDIDSGSTYREFVVPAIQNGTVDKKYADQALINTYKMRYLLGLFDPNVTNAYRNISTTVVGFSPSQEKSLFGSRQAMTLLKNANGVLPTKPGQKIAVVGRVANSSESLLGNYNGPICPSGKYDCVPTVYQKFQELNVGGTTTLADNTKDVSGAVALAKAADFVVLVIDNAADGGGEGHDRYTIGLSSDQIALADAVLATGKPTVLVMVNGGIIAIDDLKEKSPAILEAFMPGVHGAQAIAETVFGKNNPGGKLPVTMYYSNYTNEVDFLNMSMTNGVGRSYRYYTGTPIFPFGFGLSYTTFSIQWSPSPPTQTTFHGVGDQKTFTATVKNTGAVAGDEVVQAYFHPDQGIRASTGAPVPIKQLFGFERVHLNPGQSTTVQFTLNSTALAQVDYDGHTSLFPGNFGVTVSRGHGQVLLADVTVDVPSPIRLKTFRKWW